MPLDARGASSPTTDPDDIRKVFEFLHGQYRIPDVLVFRESYETERPIDLHTRISRQAHDALGKFLRDVTTCPPEVLAHAKTLLLAHEQSSSPLPLETPQPAPAIVVTREPATYRGRTPNRTPHPDLFGGLPDFAPVKSS